MKQKLIALQQTLNQHVIGRESVIKSALLSLVAGENILLIGPPGTAKSMIARSISQVVQAEQGNHYFEYLLTKFSTPEEIFGPLSISELKQDRFKRNTDGYLPTVQVAFLDEIFKASSSILNALLTILNERKYQNGTHTIDTPLVSIISASNELPTGQAELSALYDRFLIRSYVDYLPDEDLSKLFNFKSHVKSIEKLTLIDLQQIRSKAELVDFPKEVQQAILHIWQRVKDEFKDNADESLSDRRFVKCLHLMRISAVTNDRTEVDFSDVFLLKDCLWNTPESAEKIIQIIKGVLQKYNVAVDDVEQTEPKAEPKKSNKKSTKGTTLKGFTGNGTENDPFLIEHINHLQSLANPKIGRQGYYFKQVDDLDCASISLSAWFDIDFKGYYDGNGKKIVAKSQRYLFQNVVESYIANLNLEKLSLAKTVTDADIANIQTTSSMIQTATSTTVHSCHSRKSLIEKKAIKCQITACSSHHSLAKDMNACSIEYCQTNESLIKNSVNDSQIKNCQVSHAGCHDNEVTGICKNIKNSNIENCFISGSMGSLSYARSYGFMVNCQSSKIINCAIGEIQDHGDLYVIDGTDDTCDLTNNIYIDSNEIMGNIYGVECVSQVLFNQYYFENHLNWDFDNIWTWSDDKNEPELNTNIAISSQPQDLTAKDHTSKSPKTFLLEQQFKANIWL